MPAPLRTLALAAVIASLVSGSLTAQSPATGELTGRVVNSANQSPVPGVTIGVSAPPATATVARATTGANGAFRVTGLKTGQYTVRVRWLGYTPWSRASVAVGTSVVDIGTVALVPSPLELQSVAVTERRQDV